MPRVKSGVQTRRRRKKILKLAKGYFGSKRTLYRTANEQVMRSLNYAYISRRLRKRDFRKLWIQRINAACKLNGYKYSHLIHGLSLANVEINRKMLADMAVNDEAGFKQLIELSKNAVANKGKEPKKVEKVVKTEVKKVVKEEPKVEEKKEEVKEELKKEEKTSKKEVKPSKASLEALTVAELREIAKEQGLTGYSSLKKAELIEAILAAK
ncbi:MAG: 50S ribosomal protein L20 [Acholeplasmataceae bacterium]|nr:50S ribosomal protein L20 [Acholeplasmataceae bacterium]